MPAGQPTIRGYGEAMTDAHEFEQSATSTACKCGAPLAADATRCPRGHVRPLVGMPGAALKHGAHSLLVRKALLPEQVRQREALAEKRRQIEADLGGLDSISAIRSELLDRFLETSLLCEYLGQQLIDGGPFTAKGRARAALGAYLQVLDRLQRLASALGLDRKARNVPSPLDFIEGRQ